MDCLGQCGATVAFLSSFIIKPLIWSCQSEFQPRCAAGPPMSTPALQEPRAALGENGAFSIMQITELTKECSSLRFLVFCGSAWGGRDGLWTTDGPWAQGKSPWCRHDPRRDSGSLARIILAEPIDLHPAEKSFANSNVSTNMRGGSVPADPPQRNKTNQHHGYYPVTGLTRPMNLVCGRLLVLCCLVYRCLQVLSFADPINERGRLAGRG